MTWLYCWSLMLDPKCNDSISKDYFLTGYHFYSLLPRIFPDVAALVCIYSAQGSATCLFPSCIGSLYFSGVFSYGVIFFFSCFLFLAHFPCSVILSLGLLGTVTVLLLLFSLLVLLLLSSQISHHFLSRHSWTYFPISVVCPCCRLVMILPSSGHLWKFSTFPMLGNARQCSVSLFVPTLSSTSCHSTNYSKLRVTLSTKYITPLSAALPAFFSP